MNYPEIRPKSFSPLFDELAQECLIAVKFINALKGERLSEEQKEELLGELSAAITHLRIQTEYLDREFEAAESIPLL